MKKFGLTLSEEKTRKFRFNRFNKENSEPFSFLGFEFRWTYSRKGKDLLRIRTTRKKVRAIVAAFTLWCREHRSKRIRWIMGMVKSKLNGIRNYMNVPGNSARIKQVYLLYKRILYRWLNRRSERKSYTWKTFMFIWRFYNVSKCQYLYNEGVQISFLPYLG